MKKNVEKVQEIKKLKGDLKRRVGALREKKAEIIEKILLERRLQAIEERRQADCSFYENGLELLQDELRKYERQLRYIDRLC
jgi:hypothetical protein